MGERIDGMEKTMASMTDTGGMFMRTEDHGE
jgi:hypothetical protein